MRQGGDQVEGRVKSSKAACFRKAEVNIRSVGGQFPNITEADGQGRWHYDVVAISGDQAYAVVPKRRFSRFVCKRARSPTIAISH